MCTNFNQPLDFDTLCVNECDLMFYDCINLNQTFNFDLHVIGKDMFTNSHGRLITNL